MDSVPKRVIGELSGPGIGLDNESHKVSFDIPLHSLERPPTITVYLNRTDLSGKALQPLLVHFYPENLENCPIENPPEALMCYSLTFYVLRQPGIYSIAGPHEAPSVSNNKAFFQDIIDTMFDLLEKSLTTLESQPLSKLQEQSPGRAVLHYSDAFGIGFEQPDNQQGTNLYSIVRTPTIVGTMTSIKAGSLYKETYLVFKGVYGNPDLYAISHCAYICKGNHYEPDYSKTGTALEQVPQEDASNYNPLKVPITTELPLLSYSLTEYPVNNLD